LLAPFSLEYLQTVVFILVIASLVQIVEIFLKKMIPSLYSSLGLYLPLITTNCAVMGVCLLSIQKDYSLSYTLLYSFSTALGFLLSIMLMAGVRERLEKSSVPRFLKGIPIALITAGLISIAFFAFSGMGI
jgi:electron transport complex protein RnfA